jgi:enoyl-CoA hydratase/carnithine racemase
VDEANRLMAESFSRSDFAEGVRSFVERRQPKFEPVTGTATGVAS